MQQQECLVSDEMGRFFYNFCLIFPIYFCLYYTKMEIQGPSMSNDEAK